MIEMKNSLINLLQCLQRTQDDTTHVFQVIHQSQRHSAKTLINDIPTFDGKPELYFEWILKLEI